MALRPAAKQDPTFDPPSTNKASEGSSHSYSSNSPLQSVEHKPSRVLSKSRIAEQWKVSRSLRTLVFAGNLCLTVAPIAFIGMFGPIDLCLV